MDDAPKAGFTGWTFTDVQNAYRAGETAGRDAGLKAGYAAGYEAAMTVLDEAGAFLATRDNAQAFDLAAARARRDHYEKPARSAEQLRREAALSWGFPDPTVPVAEDADDDAAGPDAAGWS
jgi:hypothetical protein